ncbi:hypothetical protein [Nostoc sp.]|uniref:hypothetical protein n=1 Tax=Nostoc sp. TaxID=1180 RepID=UPI002FF52972
MAFPKKGSRRIMVDGVSYRWRYPPKPTQNQEDAELGVIVTVQQLNCYGAVLVLIFPRYHMSGSYSALELRKPVLPSEVAQSIQKALSAGWQGNKPGKDFFWHVSHS